MGNPYFQFKQFTVFHNLCAMKVGIDGVLLGAWASADKAARILDIGTGSGLIALMAAQRSESALIDAIDIEESAVQQARINVENSPWQGRIALHKAALQDYAALTEKRYDLIISNPPYFHNSLKTPDAERNNARHTGSLTHEELIIYSKRLLAPKGKIQLILPADAGEACIRSAEKSGLYCTKTTTVYPKPGTAPKRLLIEFCLEKMPVEKSELTIETGIRHQYTDEFTALARDFYLKL